jgi:hypothetical protein
VCEPAHLKDNRGLKFGSAFRISYSERVSSEAGAERSFNRVASHRWLGVAVGALVAGLLFWGPRLRPRSAQTLDNRAAASGELVNAAPRPGAHAGSATPPAAALPVSPPANASVLPAPSEPAAAGICPSDMVLVDGDYCTNVEHDCKQWLDDDLLPYARCAEYTPPARCVGKRVKLRFCIDRREYTRPGEQLPQNYASFVEASKVCESLGKRVCNESEWNFACEGPEMLPYPYGWTRAPVCNQDRTDLYEPNPKKQVLKDWRAPSGEASACKSPFGVYDMTGNMDEPVLREAQRYAYPFRNGLKGGWWMAGRNRCRPSTTAHDDHYRDIQVGIRCCRQAGPG